MSAHGLKRVVIENVKPEINGGRIPVKRVRGEKVTVTADIFSDGHDKLFAELLFKKLGEGTWQAVPMRFVTNDVYEGEFCAENIGMHIYTVRAWVDHFGTWRMDLGKKAEAGQDISLDILIGAELIESTIEKASHKDRETLSEFSEALKKQHEQPESVSVALDENLLTLMRKYPDEQTVVRYGKDLGLVVDRRKALFSAWYERFPRSCMSQPGKHGTFRECESILPEIALMGFDIFYLPPVHPIGKTGRKGKNNSPAADESDVGSPWAIGSAEGGHNAVHFNLGTLEEFDQLVKKAGEHDIEIAIDLAFQCSPDHPYVREKPEWFRWRPDGTVQYAENPPKKYEDILPLNFESEKWQELWEELRNIVEFWLNRGIRIFRVDNPHTKPFPFWEWLISYVKEKYPEVIFLSEAFTRPKVMYRLAKIGFTQSYTYFTWRNTKKEFIKYLTELTRTETREYFRPNFWPNTPDILPEHLQYGGRPAFLMRLVLASTLSSNYGIYGPPFELCVDAALPGKEEYLDSEKYELKYWDWDAPGNLKDVIGRINMIRRENPALQTTWNIEFYEVDNDYLLFYGKADEELDNIILVLVNLDPYHTQSGWVRVPLDELEIKSDEPYLVHDLVSDNKFIWHGEKNYVELDPWKFPAHIFRVRKRLRREYDFDYFM